MVTFVDNNGNPLYSSTPSAKNIKFTDGSSVQDLKDCVNGEYITQGIYRATGNNPYVDVYVSETNLILGNTYYAKSDTKGDIVFQERTETNAISQVTITTDEKGIFAFKTHAIDGNSILRFRNCTEITLISYKTLNNRLKDMESTILSTREKRMQWLSMDFVKKVSPFADGVNGSHISFYCIPDLHCCWESIKFHKRVLENADNYNSHCKFAITAGDILYSSESKGIYNDCNNFVIYAEDFAKNNTFLLPSIGGHDFNNISNAISQDESLANNLTKEEQRNLLIQPCIDLIPSKYEVNIPSDSSACYYSVKDAEANMYYVVLDECDHDNIVSGVYNGNPITLRMTSIDKQTGTFNATSVDGSVSYSNISCEGFSYVHSRYESTSYSQAQINWLVSLLKSVPEGSYVALFNHTGLLGVELHDNADVTKAVGKMIEAFVAQTTYSNSGNDGTGYSWSINADFSSCKGKLLGVFRGHLHRIFTRKDNESYYEFASSNGGYYSSENGGTKLMCEIEGDLFDYLKSQRKIRRFHIGRQGQQAKPDVDLSDYDGVVI